MRNPLPGILIAEDDDDRALARDAFAASKVLNPLKFVHDGVELLEYLDGRNNDPEGSAPLPALVLLDLNMPRMNGHQALRNIRQNPRLCHLPVVVFTTSRSEEDVVTAYRAGANSFISKPESFAQMTETMRCLQKYWMQTVRLPEAV